jgi:hypothetical protein
MNKIKKINGFKMRAGIISCRGLLSTERQVFRKLTSGKGVLGFQELNQLIVKNENLSRCSQRNALILYLEINPIES